jgi:hypothetical protein
MEETMKTITLAVLLLTSASMWAGSPSDASGYTINVHVTSSEMVLEGGAGAFNQRLKVVINSKKYELRAPSVNAVLALGDYKAKLVKDEHRTAYDYEQIYEFLFPDNKTRKFEVVGEME